MLVAPVVASLQADVVVLTEIGPLADVNTLNAALPSPYPHVAVCQCTDSATEQNVAILSRIPFTAVRPTVPGREHFLAELDDPETEDDTGISKGLSVTLTFSGEQIAPGPEDQTEAAATAREDLRDYRQTPGEAERKHDEARR